MSFPLYLLAMALTTYLIRVLPLTLFRKEIRNRYIRSLLYYVPYACLSAMTVPAVFYAADHPVSGVLGIAVGIFASYRGRTLVVSALLSSTAVLVCEAVIMLLSRSPL